MARTAATNFSGPLQFPYATAGTDIFKKEDVQTLALAVDQHTHDGLGKGLVIANNTITSAMIVDGTIQDADIALGTISGNKIGNNQITSAQIANGTIQTADLADGSVTGPKFDSSAVFGALTPGQISQCLGFFTRSGDQWSNSALSVGDNGLPTSGGLLGATIPEATDLVLLSFSVCAQINNPNTAGAFGWVVYIDGAPNIVGPMTWVPSGATGIQYAAWAGNMLIAGPGTAAGPLTAALHNFELRLRLSSTVSQGVNLRPASAGSQERYGLSVWVLRR